MNKRKLKAKWTVDCAYDEEMCGAISNVIQQEIDREILGEILQMKIIPVKSVSGIQVGDIVQHTMLNEYFIAGADCVMLGTCVNVKDDAIIVTMTNNETYRFEVVGEKIIFYDAVEKWDGK